LHLGLAYRHVGADDGKLRYRGRPETNVGPFYADTGNFDADHANHIGLEMILNVKNVSLLSEYGRGWVASPTNGNPQFSAFYMVGSWIITGETRPYDRTLGYTRRIIPQRRWGAWEVVTRVGRVDLDNRLIKGGNFTKTYVGLNWWANREWKFGIGWGHTWLEKSGTNGITDSLLTRMQWVH
jgi:phosphate-selective porin OprO/OprP